MNTDFEVLNYLNLTNPRLGKLYKLTGYNPLPDNFVMTKDLIKERLLLSQLPCKNIPYFVFESKKELKQRLKLSQKNIDKILKNSNIDGISPEFVKKMEVYFNVRREVTDAVLKDFKKVDFDECDAFLEIYAIDPIFSDLFDSDIFEKNFDLSRISPAFEKDYDALKKARTKLLEKKETKKRKTATVQEELVRQNVKSSQKSVKKQAEKDKLKQDTAKDKQLKKTKQITKTNKEKA